MKIRNYLTIFFAIIAIIALLGLAGFMTYLNADDSNPFKQTITSVVEELNLEFGLGLDLPSSPKATFETEILEDDTEAEAVTEAVSASVPSENIQEDQPVVFVGDSRTVSMAAAVNDSSVYIAKDGEGYEWFMTDGRTDLYTYLESHPYAKVVFNLGVNDPENVSQYVSVYQAFEDEFSSAVFYYMSVNPLSDDAEFNTTNSDVEEFNRVLQEAFPDHYIDCYDYLKENGFETVDGLHYTEETSVRIHDYVLDQIQA